MNELYDSGCYALASSFLEDSLPPPDRDELKALSHALAIEIQRTIEDFMASKGLQ